MYIKVSFSNEDKVKYFDLNYETLDNPIAKCVDNNIREKEIDSYI